MKILYSYRNEAEKNYAAKLLSSQEVIFHDGPLQNGNWDGRGVEILSIFVNSKIRKEELEKLPDLKFIAGRSTGFDHINLKLARKKGIVVSNVPAYGERTVAEFAFALLLAISRNILKAHKKVMAGSFSPDGLTGFDLFGKTLGVFGTGKIGKNVIKIAKGFGMDILAFDVFPDEKFAKEIGFEYTNLDEILASSDIISIHLPETKETRNIINKEKVLKMKKGMVLINTARGALVDPEALIFGLKEEMISAAGLDVLYEEVYVDDELKLLSEKNPDPKTEKIILMDHYLINHPRVLITPHTAFNTREANQRIIDTSLENIEKFLQGQPQNVVS